MRLLNKDHPNPGLSLANDSACGYQGFVNFPTIYGFLLIRILLRNNGTDLEVVHRYQSEIAITAVNRTSTPPPFRGAPPLTIELLNSSLPTSPEERILALTARLAPYNPPELTSDIANVTHNLAKAGISNGVYTP